MKRMYRVLLAVLSCILIAVSATSCIEAHEHAFDVSTLAYDGTHHFYACACGERINEEEHTFEEGVCTVCGVHQPEEEIRANGTQLNVEYDIYGNPTLLILRDKDGNELSSKTTRYEYGADGDILGYKARLRNANGSYSVLTVDFLTYSYTEIRYDAIGRKTFTMEAALSYDEDGNFTGAIANGYFPDGSSYYVEYDAGGHATLAAEFDAEGEITSVTQFENIYDDQDQFVGATSVTVYATGAKSYTEYNAKQEITLLVRYSPTGFELERHIYDRGYDEDGNPAGYSHLILLYRLPYFFERINENGDPVREIYFLPDGSILYDFNYYYDENGDLEMIIASTSDESGSYVIIYDKHINMMAYVLYDLDGEIVYAIMRDLWYDEDDNYLGCMENKEYADGRYNVAERDANDYMVSLTTYDAEGNILSSYEWDNRYDQDGNYLGCTEIEYFEDGSYAVRELDENDEVISAVYYDKDGNVIDPPVVAA